MQSSGRAKHWLMYSDQMMLGGQLASGGNCHHRYTKREEGKKKWRDCLGHEKEPGCGPVSHVSIALVVFMWPTWSSAARTAQWPRCQADWSELVLVRICSVFSWAIMIMSCHQHGQAGKYPMIQSRNCTSLVCRTILIKSKFLQIWWKFWPEPGHDETRNNYAKKKKEQLRVKPECRVVLLLGLSCHVMSKFNVFFH